MKNRNLLTYLLIIVGLLALVALVVSLSTRNELRLGWNMAKPLPVPEDATPQSADHDEQPPTDNPGVCT